MYVNSFVFNQFRDTQTHGYFEYIEHKRSHADSPRHSRNHTNKLCQKLST